MSVPKQSFRRAFSLVEIALALGIVAFVVISLLGLMAVGLDAGKLSQEDTTLAMVARTALSDLRIKPYDTLQDLREERYFTYDGNPIAGAADETAYYRCRIENLPQQIDPTWEAPGLAEHAHRLRLTFAWPERSTNPNEQVFETIIARY